MFSWWKKLLGKILFKVVKSNFWSDKSRVRLAKVLLACGADPNIPNKDMMPILLYAVLDNDTKIAKLLIDHGANLNSNTKITSNGDTFTPLHYAIKKDNIEMAKLLLDLKVDPNIQNSKGFAPLHYAVKKDNADVVTLLLEHRADPNVQDKNGDTPLHQLTSDRYKKAEDKIKMVELLLDKEADPNIKNKDGDTPLHLAIDNSNSDVVTLLLEHGADANAQNKDDETLLHKVTSDRYKKAEDKIKMVELLLDKEADPNIKNKDGKVPLERLSFFHYNEKAETKIAELLIKGGADPCVVDSDGIPFLYHAAEHGWTEMVDLLLDHKAAFNSDEEYNKQYLLNYNQSTNRDEKAFFNIIKIFFDKEVNLGLKGINILLHYAISIHYDYHDREYEKAKFELINQLIDKGANPNTKDERDATLLHYAAKKNNIKLVELLLNHKDISVDCLNKECNTPLHIASEKGYVDIVRLLLNKGASVKLPNNECNMPLHVAAEECHPEVVKLLLDSGANPNIRNGDGEVPLHKVSKFNLSLQYRNCNSKEELEKRVTRKIDTITLLFDKTNINIKNKDDKTPIELIKQNESSRGEEVIDFINNKTGPSFIQEVCSVLKEAGYNYYVNKSFKR